jgi:hypothetical protein
MEIGIGIIIGIIIGVGGYLLYDKYFSKVEAAAKADVSKFANKL